MLDKSKAYTIKLVFDLFEFENELNELNKQGLAPDNYQKLLNEIKNISESTTYNNTYFYFTTENDNYPELCKLFSDADCEPDEQILFLIS